MTRRRPCCAERGSATVWFTPMVAIIGLVTLLSGHLGAALVERRQAQAAADLAALAGASALQRGETGCARAAAIANRNHASLVDCVVDGWRLTVSVRREVDIPVLGAVPVTARARAGPVHAAARARSP